MGKITRADLDAMGYCHRGARVFFTRHGLNWSRFLADGLPVAEVAKISDPHAQRIVEYVSERDGSEETDSRV